MYRILGLQALGSTPGLLHRYQCSAVSVHVFAHNFATAPPQCSAVSVRVFARASFTAPPQCSVVGVHVFSCASVTVPPQCSAVSVHKFARKLCYSTSSVFSS